jgi:hypothetical protein
MHVENGHITYESIDEAKANGVMGLVGKLAYWKMLEEQLSRKKPDGVTITFGKGASVRVDEFCCNIMIMTRGDDVLVSFSEAKTLAKALALLCDMEVVEPRCEKDVPRCTVPDIRLEKEEKNNE